MAGRRGQYIIICGETRGPRDEECILPVINFVQCKSGRGKSMNIQHGYLQIFDELAHPFYTVMCTYII